MKSHNVAIIGAGIMGSAAADAALDLFPKVTVIEQHRRLHSLGSSTGVSRGIRLAYTDRRYIPAVRRSFELWEGLESRSGTSLLIPTGGLDFGGEEEETLISTIDSMREEDVPHEFVSPKKAAQSFDGLRLPPGSVAVYQPDAALIKADQALAALQDRAAERGAEFRFCTPVEAIQAVGNGDARTYRIKAGA